MAWNRSKSILFFNPDYHSSFFLKDELRRRGWAVDISVGNAYPAKLLFREDVTNTGTNLLLLDYALRWFGAIRYRFVVHYGRLSAAGFPYSKLIDLGLLLWCRFLKLFGTHVIYIPSGCRDHISKFHWQQVDGGNVCGNCGFEPKCRDADNNRNFSQVRKIAAVSIVGDGHQTAEFVETRIRYKSFDLEKYAPNLYVPLEFQWPRFDGIRILHSHALDTRKENNKNIKGTPSIVLAVEALRANGHNVALMNLSGIPSNEMRFHQVQADLVIDQLIYGGYGSTALECMALGKPVICYIRPSWRTFLSSIYPEWNDCPIISATPETLYDELRELIVDHKRRAQLATASREFALKFLDVKKNVIELENLLLSLK